MSQRFLKMTDKAKAPYMSYIKNGWNDNQLIKEGYAVDATGEPHPHELESESLHIYCSECDREVKQSDIQELLENNYSCLECHSDMSKYSGVSIEDLVVNLLKRIQKLEKIKNEN